MDWTASLDKTNLVEYNTLNYLDWFRGAMMARAGLDDLHYEWMLYGWRHMEERMIEAADGVSGYSPSAIRSQPHWAFPKKTATI